MAKRKIGIPKRIECYTAIPAITTNFDIVMRFRRPVFQRRWKLMHVRFDG